MNDKKRHAQNLIKNKQDGAITIIENVSKRDWSLIKTLLEKFLGVQKATIIVVKN